MKKYFIIFIFLGLIACDTDSQGNGIPLNTGKIIGSWQIVSESYSIGGPQITSDVENGSIYNFDLNGTFTYNQRLNTSLNYSGTFSFEEGVLRLDFLRDGEEAYWDLKTALNGNKITWYPVGPSICIEGCSTTLQKLN